VTLRTAEASTVDVLVVGGGVAAKEFAFALRRLGFEGSVEMASADERLPYDRTLVSKSLLGPNPVPDEHLLLAPESAYHSARIRLALNRRAVRLDSEASIVEFADGAETRFRQLVVATGGHARVPPSLGVDGVHTLRGLADAARFRRNLETATQITIIGGGLIGSEVASAARDRDILVTIVDPLAVPAGRVLGDEVGARLVELQRQRGVALRLGVTADAIEGHGKGYEVCLAGGERLLADGVILAVGAEPSIDWLRDSPMWSPQGVEVGPEGQTQLPEVYAIGDCAFRLGPGGVPVRGEHWEAARQQARRTAAVIAGHPAARELPSYFWSDQHGVKLQLVGDVAGFDDLEFDDVDPPWRYAVRYYTDAQLVATFAVGMPSAIADARRALGSVRRVAEAA
jgi:3-phenylpropionate/trans-cinnamate dioxygenase ferredoxin reductase component